jgi:hypothetical protein
VLPLLEVATKETVQLAPRQRRKRQTRKCRFSSLPAAAAEAAANSAGCTKDYRKNNRMQEESHSVAFFYYSFTLGACRVKTAHDSPVQKYLSFVLQNHFRE